MTKLIDVNGAYLHTEFKKDGIKWILIGTEAVKHDVNTFRLTREQFREHVLVTTQDTFKSEKGEYKTCMRYTIDIQFNQGIIKV